MADEEPTDELADETKVKIKEVLEKEIESGLTPYLDQITNGLARLIKLVSIASAIEDPGVRDSATPTVLALMAEIPSEILRAVVVLSHAYLEDFLRTLARTFLPVGGEAGLNKVPLAGSAGRAEKFFLGALAAHREKTVEQLIRESVEEHMEQRSFNDVTEIMTFLKSLGLDISLHEGAEGVLSDTDHRKVLSDLDAMMQRRHMIVHNADLDAKRNQLRPISKDEVIQWLKVTQYFLSNVAKASFVKEHPREAMTERVLKALSHSDTKIQRS